MLHNLTDKVKKAICLSVYVRDTYTVPLPLGRPRALTVGLLGVEGVEGNTEDRKLEAGDGGTDENGEDISELAGDMEASGGGGGGGGGKSWVGPDGEDKLLELRKGGGGGGKDGELGDSTLPALEKGGTVTLLKALCEVGGDKGEDKLDPEEPEDWVT